MIQREPLFSIIVPVYNQAQYLGQALETLQAQTDPDWEAVVVDDGSTDATPAVIAGWAAREPRIRAFRKINGGVASALNLGARQARGKWFCWLSSDDLFEPGKLGLHRTWIESHQGARFFYSFPRSLNDATGAITNPRTRYMAPEPRWQVIEHLRKNLVSGNSVCVLRSALLEDGAFDESLQYGQDYDAWLRLMARAPAVLIPERTCITRTHPEQASRAFKEAGSYDSAKSAIRFLNQTPFAQWFPELDLSSPPLAREAFMRALLLAVNERAVVYRLGAHPTVVNRMLEWLWRDAPAAIRHSLQRTLRERAARVSRRLAGTPFGLMWKAIAVATRGRARPFSYTPIDHRDVARNHGWWLRTGPDPDGAGPLARWLERFEEVRFTETAAPGAHRGQEAIVERGVDGALKWSAVDIGRRLQHRGWQVLVASLTDSPVHLTEDLFAISPLSSDEWRRGLLMLRPFDLRIPAALSAGINAPGAAENGEPPAALSESELESVYRTPSGISNHLHRMVVSALRVGDIVQHRLWLWRDRRQRR